jgi:hypothetical protein
MSTMEDVRTGRPTAGVTGFVAQVMWEICEGRLRPIGSNDELPIPEWPLERKFVLVFDRPTLPADGIRICQVVNVLIDGSTKNLATLNIVWLIGGRATPQDPLWKVEKVRYFPDHEAVGTDFAKELTTGISMPYRKAGVIPEGWQVNALYTPDRQAFRS